MLIDETIRDAILTPIDGGLGVNGREDEGEAAELLRDIRLKRKDRVRAEQALALDEDDAAVEDGVESWEAIAEDAIRYLTEFGKDLEPMAILIEASAREDDPAQSLAVTMTLLADFVEAFWEQGLYPAADEDEEDGVEARFMPLSGLSGGTNDREGSLVLPVRQMALVKAGSDVLRYGDKVMVDAASQSQAGDADAKAARAEARQSAYDSFDRIVTIAGRARMAPVLAAVTTAETQWRRVMEYLIKQASPYMPAGSRLTSELEGMREWLKALVARLPEEVSEESEGAAETADAGASANGGGSAGTFKAGKIDSREDALRAVNAAADYFARREPHSPVGKALREIDRRARMDLQELIAELIPTADARTEFYWRSGIRPPTEDTASVAKSGDDDW
ncbi:type VI secretion system protein TssA [Erythrobacter sp. EC-HK427]|uniref:type VI secretion system protein TssA n=1 Tax=Erythrobacter sp. EC-HK427 TaxID=2038396 RepID=UPI001258FBD8|nr:type VI secretion system ImpA family N-terminal domain-containing protein [Erythrobacter sp. EC-HK427]VVT18019.1 Type VI secretion system protein ImpA [Erythrobacter sp. EC-HK427]